MKEMIDAIKTKISSESIEKNTFDVIAIPSCQKCCLNGNGGNGTASM